MKNPDDYCCKCGRRWRAHEEMCPECGFDPVYDEDDEATNEEAGKKYREGRT